jgi:hypothetical protein
MNAITISRINRALKKEVGSGVKFRAGNGEGILRFKEDNPPPSKINAAVEVINRFTRWQPDYGRMEIVDEF